jgi:DNA-binding GntR family transcriptional regulator
MDPTVETNGNRMRPDEIVSLLRRAIRERVLVPGQSLNQDDLAKRFGVSRVPLREALRTLVGEGLVVMRPGIGAVVTELDPNELDELLSLRAQLEPPLTAAIVGRAGRSDFARLRQMVTQMSQVADSDMDAWSTQHYLLHRRIFELAGRPHSVRLVTQVLNLVEPYMRLQAAQTGARDHDEEHLRILDALEAGDADRAAALTAQSIESSRKHLAEFLPSAYLTSDSEDPLALLRDVVSDRSPASLPASRKLRSAPSSSGL